MVEHLWQTRSRHPTSDGIVTYQRCHCGLWRLRLDDDRVLADRVLADRVGARLPKTVRLNG